MKLGNNDSPETLSRENLYFRHQLSHQQIDDLLGDQGSRGFRESKAQMLLKYSDFLWFCGILNEGGISFIPLKGFLLSQKIYDDPSYRITGDFDVFVFPEEVDHTIALLAEKGFKPAGYSWPQNPVARKRMRRIFLHYQMIHEERNIIAEIHWKLISYPPVSQSRMLQLIRDNLKQTRISDIPIRTLNNEFELLYLIIHGSLHNWRRMKWLVDVQEMLDRCPVNEKRFLELVRAMKAERLVSLCNALLEYYFTGRKKLPGSDKAMPSMVSLCRDKINSPSDREYDNLWGLIRYLSFVYTAFPGLTHKKNLTTYLFLSTFEKVRLKLLKKFGKP
jgi:hypothetical protein